MTAETRSTIDRIKAAARSASQSASQAVNKITTNPTVKKAGEILQEKSNTFQKNISYKEQSQQQPQKVVQKVIVVKKSGKIQKAPSGKKERVSIAGSQNDNPFGIGNLGGGLGGPMGNPNSGTPFNQSGGPLGRNFVPFDKRKKNQEDENPFHL